MVYVRGALDYDTDAASDASGLSFAGEVSLTQQQFAEDADINTIVRRFGLTGTMPETLAMPRSGDFTGVVDFQTAKNVVRQAEEAFMEVPADIRYRFHNDPGQMLAFVYDESNREEAIKLGLIPKPKEVVPEVVVPV